MYRIQVTAKETHFTHISSADFGDKEGYPDQQWQKVRLPKDQITAGHSTDEAAFSATRLLCYNISFPSITITTARAQILC